MGCRRHLPNYKITEYQMPEFRKEKLYKLLEFWGGEGGGVQCPKENIFFLSGGDEKTLPKALRTQVLSALTSNFGLVGLVSYT